MKLLFDISNLLNSEGGGIHYYLKGLISALLQEPESHNLDIEFINFYFRNKSLNIPSFLKPDKLHNFRFPVKLLNKLWLNFNFPDLGIFYKNIDIVHSPHFSLPVLGSAKKILTVHDITYLKHPEYFDPRYRELNNYGYKQLLPVNIKRADHIIAISDFTKNDLIDYFNISPDKVTTVYTGVDIPKKIDSEDAKAYLNQNNLTPDQYVYFPAGTLEPRKNIPLTIQALKKSNISKNIKLVISGVGAIDWLGIKEDDRIRLLRWNSTEERDILYQNASFVVYPSLYEGFGMPVIEAMSNGKAVMTSNTTSLGELANDYAQMVNPESLEELVEAFNLLSDKTNRLDLENKSKQRAMDFSWEKMASETYKVYEKSLSQ
jgi:glycosyltransferase involved in cell wall biosynthesis